MRFAGGGLRRAAGRELQRPSPNERLARRLRLSGPRGSVFGVLWQGLVGSGIGSADRCAVKLTLLVGFPYHPGPRSAGPAASEGRDL